MATAARNLPDWGTEPPVYPLSKRVWLVVALVGPVLVLLLAVALLTEGSWFGVGLFTFLFATTTGFYAVGFRRRFLRKLKAVPLEDARFRNLVEGLVQSHGLPSPELFLVEGEKPNAVLVRGRPPVLGVTRSLLDTYSRTEQEAVAAHCLVRLHTGHLFFSELAGRFGRAASRFAPKVGYEDDVQTVAITRYPPGLARALEQAGPVQGISACLWFAAHGPSHRPVAARIDALEDL